MLGIPFSIRYRIGMLGIPLFVVFHIVNASGGSTDETCPSLSIIEFDLKPPGSKNEWAKMKGEYMKCIKSPQCDTQVSLMTFDSCVKAIQKYLPLLLEADKIEENEVGESFVEQACVGAEEKYKNCRRSDYKEYLIDTLSLTEGVTLSKKNEIITIDGTVKGVVGGKRNYDTYYQKLRPIGLYAPKGKIVTIDVPKEMIGKLGVIVGLLKYGDQFKLEFPPTKKSVLKVASPWGGPIILRIAEKNANKGLFNITVNNALRTPIFIYGQHNNSQWNNELKNYSPNWAVLKIPRQLDILINSDRIKYVTDMEAAMSRVKHTMDLLEEMIGLPPNSKPGADIWSFGFGGGGLRYGRCSPGLSDVGAKYIKELLETGWQGLVLHEAGHGYCYDDLPYNGKQWTAEHVSSYIRYKLGPIKEDDDMDSPDLDFDLMYRMVAFGLYSNGKACGDAKFYGKQLKFSSYDICWKWLSWIPEKAHGWDVYKEVNTLVANSKTNYTSSSDRMIDLYCQATKHNMLPLFTDLYNLKPASNIKENCEKLPKSELIGNWLDIVQCVKESMTTGVKDIRQCAKLPHFPKHEGICVLSGECQNDEANLGMTTMKNKFDLYGSTHWPSKKFSADKETNCLKRAKDYFKDCKNKDDQKITATFYRKKTEDEVSYIYPPLDEMIWEESKSSFQYPQCKRATRKLYIRGLDIASCKAECLNCRMCKKNSKCNAINVLDGKYCKLLDCTEPIQEPLFRGGTSYGWKSYFTKYSRSKPWRQILDENCVTACGRGGSCPKFCGLRGYCCKYGDASCPYMATKASPNGYTCVTQEKASVETWRQKDGADCWSKCGRKGGPCPNFCGSNGFCCRKGYGGCPLGAAKESPKHHTCVLKQGTETK